VGASDKVLEIAEAVNDGGSKEFGIVTNLVEDRVEEATPVSVSGTSNGRRVCSGIEGSTAGSNGFGTGSGTADISALG